MIPTLGASAQPSAPTRNSPAHTQQGALAAQHVGKLPPSSAPNGGAGKEQELTTVASLEVGQAQVVLHVQQGARDDAGVVAEQQAAEGGDDGEPDQVAA